MNNEKMNESYKKTKRKREVDERKKEREREFVCFFHPQYYFTPEHFRLNANMNVKNTVLVMIFLTRE